jgi:hypothetical protein
LFLFSCFFLPPLPPPPPPPPPRDQGAPGLSATDAARLQADLDRFD